MYISVLHGTLNLVLSFALESGCWSCRIHSDNFEVLKIGGETLDWSLMCPGVLRDAGPSVRQLENFTFTEEAPIWLPQLFLKASALHLLAALVSLVQLRKFSATLDDVAAVMVNDIGSATNCNLCKPSKLSKLRVGIARD